MGAVARRTQSMRELQWPDLQPKCREHDVRRRPRERLGQSIVELHIQILERRPVHALRQDGCPDRLQRV